MTIRRAFAETSIGQMHYRFAGSGHRLLLCHASPGSAKQLEPLISALASHYHVIAPDTPGFGDSAALPLDSPVIADFASLMFEFCDAVGLARFDVYGTHTGAGIAAEMAIAAPDRIRHLVLDGIPQFDDAERDAFLRDYAHPFRPDLDGAYLTRAFQFCRDQYLFFPWYARDAAHRRDGGLPPPAALHHWVLEVLKASGTYHLGYRAAFAYPGAERARLITQPILALAAADDPLRDATAAAVAGMPLARFAGLPRYDDPRYIEHLAKVIIGFLGVEAGK